MVDLEEEFEKLRNAVLKQIVDKQSAGELEAGEAQQLINMVYDRMYIETRGRWNSSNCSIGVDYETDDGWQGSSVIC